MSELDAYREAMTAAIGEAIDAGLFYNKDVEAHVHANIAVADPEKENFLGIVRLPKGFSESQKALAELAAQVKSGHRGTWAVTETVHDEGSRPIFKALYADGSGSLAPGGTSDTFEEPPAYAHVKHRVFTMEVYLSRRALEADRLKAIHLEALASGRVAEGSVFKDVKIRSDTFSTVKVTSVDAETGQVGIALTKRGSRKRYSTTVGAAFLSPPPEAKPEEPGASTAGPGI